VIVNFADAQHALGQAQNVADYQAIGMRSRELLLSFISAAQDSYEWTDGVPPKRADFRAWTDVICNTVLHGSGQKERRQLVKSLLEGVWTFTNWLTHTKSATWHDAETALSTVEHAVGLCTSLVIRHIRGVPEQCPECGSPNLSPEEGRRTDIPDIVWERSTCADCGWTGEPVPVAEEPIGEDEGLITRVGHDEANNDCIIPGTPLRGLRKPGHP
jgi:hypothetical protein